MSQSLVEKNECRTALDIGCGDHSCLSMFRPRLVTAGSTHLPSLDICRGLNLHDHYHSARHPQRRHVHDSGPIQRAEVRHRHADRGDRAPAEARGAQTPRKVERHPPIEIHRPETPNGFIEQGAEFGNEYQRHLSGWFPHDFEGYGYTVYGTTGTKYLRGYMAGPKYNFRGAGICDILLTRVLRAHVRPKHAFNLVAIKDVRRLSARNFPAHSSSRG